MAPPETDGTTQPVEPPQGAQKLQQLLIPGVELRTKLQHQHQLIQRLWGNIRLWQQDLEGARRQLREQEVELNQLTEEITNTYEELSLLYDLGKSSTLDLAEIYRNFEHHVQRALVVGEGALVVEREGRLAIVAAWGQLMDNRDLQEFCRVLAQNIQQRNDPLLINDLEARRESHWRTLLSPALFKRLHRLYESGQVRNMLTVPLRAEKGSMGAVVLFNRLGAPPSHQEFLARDQKLLMALARQTAMAIETASLSQRLVGQRRMERELEIASNIQASLLPRRPPRVAGLEVAGRCLPANEVGGDYFDYLPVGNGLGIPCGDVMGKGVPAALVMAMTHSAVRSVAINNPGPGQLLEKVNNIMYEDCDRIETNLTLCYAYFDPTEPCMYFGNAGHLPPLIWRADQNRVELVEPSVEEKHPSTMIGVLPEATYGETRIDLSPGDVVLLYTDGVSEAVNREGEYYGEHRLTELLQAHARDPVGGIVEEVFNTVNRFAAGLPQADDITVIAVKVKEEGGKDEG